MADIILISQNTVKLIIVHGGSLPAPAVLY